jgi:hypothetical protein
MRRSLFVHSFGDCEMSNIKVLAVLVTLIPRLCLEHCIICRGESFHFHMTEGETTKKQKKKEVEVG